MKATLPEAYLLIEVSESGRFHVFKYRFKHEVTKIGSESGINQVVVHDDSIAGQHLEIIYSEGDFFLRRVAQVAVTLDGRFMESPSEKLIHGAVIEVDKVRMTFLSGYAGMDTAVFLKIWTHDSDSAVPFITTLVASRNFCVGSSGCDLLLKDQSLEKARLEFENFGPNAITVQPSRRVEGLFLNDTGLITRARLVPGDRIVMAGHSIGVDFLAASILEDLGVILSEEVISRYRLLPT